MKPKQSPIGLDQAIAQFLTEHPDELNGVEYRTLKEGEDPAMILRTDTFKRFLVWSKTYYPPTHPERIPAALSFITQVEHGEITPTTEESNWIFQK
jgi:hypothetical protein